MYKYKYTREIIEGNGWDINNPFRVDSEGNEIYLSTEVETSFPDKKFKLYCNGGIAIFSFEEEISSSEKETLDAVVYNHKNNL